MTPLVPGFYGKLPSHGDFVRRRLTGPFVGLWDSWLQNAIARSKEQLGANWLEIYLGSPLWRFVFTPGVCGPDMSAGVLMPSVDKAGRYFPLTMVVNLPDPVNPLPLAAEYDDWFSRAESILLSALDDSVRFELDEFDRQVEDCVLEFTSPPKLPAGSEATVFPGQAKSWHIGIASVDHLGASLRHLHWKQLGEHFKPLSMWWSNGSEHVAPSALLSEGIPPADSYAAMLDGQWRTREWPSIQLESVSRLTQRAAAAVKAAPETHTREEVAEPEPEPGPDAPPLDAEQPSVAPQRQEIIPEFDPLEFTSPDEGDSSETREARVPEQASASVDGQETVPEPDPVMASTPTAGVIEELGQTIPEVDPLHAIDAAQRSGTPLDPLEALGLADGTGDDLGVSGMPASYSDGGDPELPAEAPDTEAVSLADPLESPTLPNQTGEVEFDTQPQAIEPAVPQSPAGSPVFYSAAVTDAGTHSDFNEDALLERRDVALWAVADGGGGHWVGDVASQAVISELETVTPSAVLGDLADDVKSKLLLAHRYLQENLDRNADSSGDSGAAVAVFVATENMSACLSAGPVRIYRSRNGDLERLTPDTGSQARLIGHEHELLVDSQFHEVEVGDRFLLCSRGLYEGLDDRDIAQILSASDPVDACKGLMSEALTRGAQNNVTVVVVHAASPDEA